MIPLITLSSDFAVQSQGVGAMEATAFAIAPHARIVHWMHGIAGFDVTAAARTMETIHCIGIGFHVCVCDPGVGTSRRGIAIETARGDFLVGPDNGLFIPATRALGGIVRVHQLTNTAYQRQPVSPIFHGRDIFAPAAAHLATGIALDQFGPAIDPETLVRAPYAEAERAGNALRSTVIQINHFGSVHLNISHEAWDACGIEPGAKVTVRFSGGRSVSLPVCRTFGDVPAGENLIMKDDYARIEIAKNVGSFISEFPVRVGDSIEVLF